MLEDIGAQERKSLIQTHEKSTPSRRGDNRNRLRRIE